MSTVNQAERQANTVRRYEFSATELPMRCPLPGSSHWSSHPQVYLQPDENGKARCPYCSAEFVLK